MMKTKTESDRVEISRETFLNLVAAAEMARAWMAHRAPCDNWANNTRRALHNALSAAVAEKPPRHLTTFKHTVYYSHDEH
jgi:hypothetical protein